MNSHDNFHESLPAHHGLDVAAFSRTLNDTTTANKFLWLLGILRIIESRNSAVIPFRDISYEMVRLAVPPVYEFKLNFGGTDKTRKYLDRIFQFSAPLNGSGNVMDNSSEAQFEEVRQQMEKYVPYRLLTPFFAQQLRGLKDYDKNARIADLAKASFNTKNQTPYRFVNLKTNASVELHPKWHDYFRSNMAVVRGWVMWNWAAFLQDRNPSIPGVINKIQHSSPERLMSKQREFWREIMKYKNGNMTCIYSERQITLKESDIDHYIPWSFIGHCHLWNLIPAHSEVNRSKGNNIPAKKYLRKLAEVQHDALMIREKNFSGKFKQLIEPYYDDLRLTKLTNYDELLAAYERTLTPMIAIAANNQFSPNWTW